MINLERVFVHYQFNGRERFYSLLGLVIIAIVGITVLIGYGFAPLFTGKTWHLVSPGLHLISGIVGVVLLWLGSGKAMKHKLQQIDLSFRRFLLYRFIRFAFSGLLRVIASAVGIIVFLLSDENEPTKKPSLGIQPEGKVDDIWDSHPRHYWDKDPPEPFS